MYGTMRIPIPTFLFRWLPHRWEDSDFFDYLEAYEGPYIRAVTEDPDEFVRDGFKMYDAVVERDRSLKRRSDASTSASLP